MIPSVRLLAEWVNGDVVGNGDTTIASALPLYEAGPGDLTFVDGERNLPAWKKSPAAAAIVSPTFPQNGRPLIVVANPKEAFATIILRLRKEAAPARAACSVDPSARISASAEIGDEAEISGGVDVGHGSKVGHRCRLYPGVVVGKNCRIGDDVTLHPNVVIYDNTVIGNRCTVHANAVIGGDGYGYRTEAGRHAKIPHVGWVEIEDDVEIGCGSTIDRGMFGTTRVGEGTKIDNLVMVGHNTQIGRHNLICAQAGVAGSCKTGDYVVMGGQAGLIDHITLADRTMVAAASAVIRDVPEAGAKVAGYPAAPVKHHWRIHALQEKLPKIVADLKNIKQALGIEV